MLATERIIHCVNPNCPHPVNAAKSLVCAACQTPLIRRYAIAVSDAAAKYTVGTMVAQRYRVIAPHIWLDTQPGQIPDLPMEIDGTILPYLRLYPYRLHLPQVYGVVADGDGEIVLLENVPLDGEGKVYPSLADIWSRATGVRQVYWLWQILELWQPLMELGVAASLLNPENLRVQGWCVRLVQLNGGRTPTLKDLGNLWESWVASAHPGVAEGLRNVLGLLRSPHPKLTEIRDCLNRLLLSAAADTPLRIDMMGATDSGAASLQNEDTCFPTNQDAIDDPLLPRAAIVCDGIGGHEGGEVASRMAVQSVKLQVRALLTEVAQSQEIVTPDILQRQLAASLRIVNNLICGANNSQQRQGKQRMGTTIAIALQVPQKVQTVMGWDGENSHEVYIASVGDSRAYFITRDGCQLLTVDDDVTTREVSHGRSLYRQALERLDATGLTQALGAKEGEQLHPKTQRLMIDEDGILLLCSDGLSDNLLVERTWDDYALPVLLGEMTMEEGLYGWLKCAARENGHDNISLVLTYFRTTPKEKSPNSNAFVPDLLVTNEQKSASVSSNLDQDSALETHPWDEEDNSDYFSSSAQELFNTDPDLTATNEVVASSASSTQANPKTQTSKKKPTKTKSRASSLISAIAFLIILTSATSIGLFAWWKYAPQSFQQACRRLPAAWEERVCPK